MALRGWPATSHLSPAADRDSPQNYVREFTDHGVRPDGRALGAYRRVTVQPSVLSRNSRGSAMVTLDSGGDGDGDAPHGARGPAAASGVTRAVAACTLLVGRPSAAAPSEGEVEVTVGASPMSGPRFDVMGRENSDNTTGNYAVANRRGAGGGGEEDDAGYASVMERMGGVTHPGHDSSDHAPCPTDVREVESWVRRVVRASGYVDPSDLGIERGRSAWSVRVTVRILEHGGNVRDCALLAACAALRDLRLPPVEVEGRGGSVRLAADGPGEGGTSGRGRRRIGGRGLSLGPLPTPTTVALLPDPRGGDGRVMLVDPTHLEEDVSAGNLVTVVCDPAGRIVEMHKRGSTASLTVDRIKAVVAIGTERARVMEGLMGKREG